MTVLEKYTGAKTYAWPDGRIADRDSVLARFPAALTFTHIVHTDEGGEILLYLYNLSNMRSLYKIDTALSETAAIAEIQRIMNLPPPEPVEGTMTNEEITDFISSMLGGYVNG